MINILSLPVTFVFFVLIPCFDFCSFSLWFLALMLCFEFFHLWLWTNGSVHNLFMWKSFSFPRGSSISLTQFFCPMSNNRNPALFTCACWEELVCMLRAHTQGQTFFTNALPQSLSPSLPPPLPHWENWWCVPACARKSFVAPVTQKPVLRVELRGHSRSPITHPWITCGRSISKSKSQCFYQTGTGKTFSSSCIYLGTNTRWGNFQAFWD